MKNCYDNIDETFICQLQKIKCLFADRVYSEYKDVRFGIKTCKTSPSLLQLSDLKELIEYIYTMDISNYGQNTYRNAIIEEGTLQAMVNDGCIPAFAVETLKVCNISNLIEKINTL